MKGKELVDYVTAPAAKSRQNDIKTKSRPEFPG